MNDDDLNSEASKENALMAAKLLEEENRERLDQVVEALEHRMKDVRKYIDTMATHIRQAMTDYLPELEAEGDEDLERWISQQRPENLQEWLGTDEGRKTFEECREGGVDLVGMFRKAWSAARKKPGAAIIGTYARDEDWALAQADLKAETDLADADDDAVFEVIRSVGLFSPDLYSEDDGENWLRGFSRLRVFVEVQHRRLPPLDWATVIDEDGDEYFKVPKHGAGMSWAWDGAAVEVDGEEYVAQPGQAATRVLLPASVDLLPKEYAERPHQACLPMDLENYEGEPLALTVLGSTGRIMKPLDGKLALLIMAAHHNGSQTTVDDLATVTHPDAARVQRRHHVAVAESLERLDSLHLYLPDRTKVRVFDLHRPRSPKDVEADMRLCLGMGRRFEEVALRAMRGNPYRGAFLVNKSGAMRLDNRHGAHLRHLVRASAGWNAAFLPDRPGDFNSAALKAYTREEWALLVNALSPAAMEYLRDKHGSRGLRRRLSRDLKAAFDTLADLEGMGLLRLERNGRDRLRVLPPEPYQEAKRRMKSRGGRPAPK